jgi:outer membrane immunogenic protein
MRHFKFFASLTAISVVFAAPAFAADLPGPAPSYSAPVQQSYVPFSWTGAYVGVMGGYSWGEFDNNAGISLEGDGYHLGAYAGYNHQLHSNFVLGIEADIAASGLEDTTAGVKAEQNYVGTVRGRAGYAMDNYLFFVTGGLAYNEVEVRGATGISDDNMHLGYAVGTGVEALVTDSISARLEYQYTNFSDETYNIGAPVSADLDAHTVRAGIGYKF